MSDVKTRGRSLTSLELEILGSISPGDLVERETEGNLVSSETPTLARLRGIHHDIARLLSSGLTPAEVSATTGYSPSRISTLQNDPSFKELLAFYRDKETEVFVDVRKRLAMLGLDASAELTDRLVEKPESFTNTQLIELTKATLDRAGYNPVAKSVSASVSISPDELAQIRGSLPQSNVQVLEVMDASYKEIPSEEKSDGSES